MTKKKPEAVDEPKKNEPGEVADNMGINSQDITSEPEEITNIEDIYTGKAPEEGIETGSQEETDASAKETSIEDSLLAKLAEMQDKYIRLSAEFDNYRKRTLREKIELTRHAGENILISIVPVMDDFERALKLMESSTDSVAIKSGIDLIYNKFSDFLKQNGIREIEALNSKFNVDLHESVSKVPVEDENLKGKVVEVLQKGYFLHDKVMRFSKVVVGE